MSKYYTEVLGRRYKHKYIENRFILIPKTKILKNIYILESKHMLCICYTYILYILYIYNIYVYLHTYFRK